MPVARLLPASLDLEAAAIAALDGLTDEQRTLLQQLVTARSRTRRPLGLRDFKTSARRGELGLPDYWDVREHFGSLNEALRLLSRLP